jgi:hypothetical protein
VKDWDCGSIGSMATSEEKGVLHGTAAVGFWICPPICWEWEEMPDGIATLPPPLLSSYLALLPALSQRHPPQVSWVLRHLDSFAIAAQGYAVVEALVGSEG